jgi:hypothetical protein
VLLDYQEHGPDAARQALKPIATCPHSIPRPLGMSERLEIYLLDEWLCRYCGRTTILTQLMMLLDELFPEDFPYHPNWKTGLTHPAFPVRSASVDHISPVAHGGSGNDPLNLVTACLPCKVVKGEFPLDQLGWTLRPIRKTTTGMGFPLCTQISGPGLLSTPSAAIVFCSAL